MGNDKMNYFVCYSWIYSNKRAYLVEYIVFDICTRDVSIESYDRQYCTYVNMTSLDVAALFSEDKAIFT